MAGGIFFLLNQPPGTGVTIILSSPTAAVSSPDATRPQTATDDRTDINSAAAAELMALPGIGEVRAQAIADYRAREEPFQRTDPGMLERAVACRCLTWAVHHQQTFQTWPLVN